MFMQGHVSVKAQNFANAKLMQADLMINPESVQELETSKHALPKDPTKASGFP